MSGIDYGDTRLFSAFAQDLLTAKTSWLVKKPTLLLLPTTYRRDLDHRSRADLGEVLAESSHIQLLTALDGVAYGEPAMFMPGTHLREPATQAVLVSDEELLVHYSDIVNFPTADILQGLTIVPPACVGGGYFFL